MQAHPLSVHFTLASEQQAPSTLVFSYLSSLQLVTVDAKSSADAALLPQLVEGDPGSLLPTEAARQLLQGRRYDPVEGKGKPYRLALVIFRKIFQSHHPLASSSSKSHLLMLRNFFRFTFAIALGNPLVLANGTNISSIFEL